MTREQDPMGNGAPTIGQRIGDLFERIPNSLKIIGASGVAALGLGTAELVTVQDPASADNPPQLQNVHVATSSAHFQRVGHTVKIIDAHKSGVTMLEVNSPTGEPANEPARGCTAEPAGYTYWNTAYTSPDHTNPNNLRKWRQTVTTADTKDGKNIFCIDEHGDTRKKFCWNLIPTPQEAQKIPTVVGKFEVVPRLDVVVLDTFRETLQGSVHAEAVCPDNSASAEARASGSVSDLMQFRIESHDVTKASLLLRARAKKVMGSLSFQDRLEIKLVNDHKVHLDLEASASVTCGTPKVETVTVTVTNGTTVTETVPGTTTTPTTTLAPKSTVPQGDGGGTQTQTVTTPPVTTRP